MPAIELIRRYHTSDVFIYCDPPYLWETRKRNLYKYEMTKEDHIELLELLRQHPAKIMISGYDNSLYDSYLVNWHKVYKQTRAEQGKIRTEVLWMNYKPSMNDDMDIDHSCHHLIDEIQKSMEDLKRKVSNSTHGKGYNLLTSILKDLYLLKSLFDEKGM